MVSNLEKIETLQVQMFQYRTEISIIVCYSEIEHKDAQKIPEMFRESIFCRMSAAGGKLASDGQVQIWKAIIGGYE